MGIDQFNKSNPPEQKPIVEPGPAPLTVEEIRGMVAAVRKFGLKRAPVNHSGRAPKAPGLRQTDH